jgi:outer membrane lipoprotein
MKNIGSVIFVLILIGCASQAPVPISKIPVGNVSVAEVRADTARFIDSEVRWGGVITKVENKASQTWVEIVSRKLNKNGQPKVSGESGGRFIASFKGFADPIVYKTGNLLTVLGTVEGQTTRPIGEYAYSFPVVTVTASYLWQVEPNPVQYDYPPPSWYYDPWPFYPWPYPPYYW